MKDTFSNCRNFQCWEKMDRSFQLFQCFLYLLQIFGVPVLSNKKSALFFSTNNDKYMVKPSLYYNDKERVVFDVEKKIENENTVFYFTQQTN